MRLTISGWLSAQGEERKKVAFFQVLLFQHIEDGTGPLLTPTDIKGERHLFFVGFHTVNRFGSRFHGEKYLDVVLFGIEDACSKEYRDDQNNEPLDPLAG